MKKHSLNCINCVLDDIEKCRGGEQLHLKRSVQQLWKVRISPLQVRQTMCFWLKGQEKPTKLVEISQIKEMEIQRC